MKFQLVATLLTLRAHMTNRDVLANTAACLPERVTHRMAASFRNIRSRLSKPLLNHNAAYNGLDHLCEQAPVVNFTNHPGLMLSCDVTKAKQPEIPGAPNHRYSLIKRHTNLDTEWTTHPWEQQTNKRGPDQLKPLTCGWYPNRCCQWCTTSAQMHAESLIQFRDFWTRSFNRSAELAQQAAADFSYQALTLKPEVRSVYPPATITAAPSSGL